MAPAERGRPGRVATADATARAFAALDEMPVGAALMRPVRDDGGTLVDFVYAYANNRAGDIAGAIPASTLRGRRVHDALPAFPDELFEAMTAVLEGGEPHHTVLDYSDRFAGHPEFSGRFQVTTSRLGDELLMIFDDVGARDRARSAERRYAALLEATTDWVSIADRDLRLTFVNAGGRQMVGIGPDEDVGDFEAGDFSPQWARDYVRNAALAIVRRDGVWRGNLARRHRDGREIPVSQVIVASTGSDGEIDFYATIARDMTGERVAEAALRASEERFRIIFEQAPIGASVLGLDGRFVQVNDAFCRTVRRTRDELLGVAAAAITHPDDIALTEHAIAQLVAGERTASRFEKRYLSPDGESIWAETSASVLHDHDGRPQAMVAMIAEMGERRLARTLQRSMLTTQLPAIAGMQLAARYLPGSTEAEICGDWYDVIPLPQGHVGIVIGDVVGRGLEAAATMSQLRTALRAYAIEGLEPAEVVRKLHRLVDHLGEGIGTTLAYLDLDPATRELRYVSAGHMPVLLVDAAGVSSYLPGARSTPLGTLWRDGEVPQARHALQPGESILLYTDGLVERRDAGIAGRLEQLRAAMAGAPADLDGCLEHVTTTLTGDAVRFDDIALLALRVGAGEA
ncbi:MAG TPA: SpoIIE family protein phosphatase [Solirubrobacteraceae bacterium]|jgi:PAS domain S-box-containing protein